MNELDKYCEETRKSDRKLIWLAVICALAAIALGACACAEVALALTN